MRLWPIVLCALAACQQTGIDRPALIDPSSCAGCHPDQAREWEGSMHAYASDDPVFLALDRLGQEQTGGALGTLCTGCHAPIATATGATSDGLDLPDLPRELRGVTCVACHQIADVTALHNGGLTWRDDQVVEGPIADPVANPAHGSAYSPLLDDARVESSGACGACHDVALPGVPIEQTYAEWSTTIFATGAATLSCAGCHMPGRDAPAAFGERTRRVHDHSLPGVDGALVDWPGTDAQAKMIDRDLGNVLTAKLCVAPHGSEVQVDVTLDDAQAGHSFPSGVTHARRAWLELTAEEGGAVTFTSGNFTAGEPIALDDPDAWVLGSQLHDASGAPTDGPWNAASIENQLLLPVVTRDPSDPSYYHAVTRSYFVPGTPDTIRIRERIVPLGIALDPALAARMRIHDLAGTEREWRFARDGWGCAP